MATASEAPAESGRLCQFSKTKMCKFHVLGKCTKGLQCPFAHDPKELRNLPDLRCTKLCKTFIQTGECKNKTCLYAHSKEELRSQGAFHKTKLCRFMQTGHCSLGAKCNFAHSSVELREPEVIAALVPPPGLGSGGDTKAAGAEIAPDLSGSAGRTKDMPQSPGLQPAYVHIPQTEVWTSCAMSILEENTELEEEVQLPSPDHVDEMDSWGLPDPVTADSVADFQPWDFGNYGHYNFSHFASGVQPGDWSGYWAGSPMLGPCAGSYFDGGFSSAWDWQLPGDSFVIDQKDDLKVEGPVAFKAAPKMRPVRTSETTLCTLADTAYA